MDIKNKTVIDYSTQSPINAARFKWNFAARKFYEGEKRALGKGNSKWTNYDNLSFEEKDYYRARAQELTQADRGYTHTA